MDERFFDFRTQRIPFYGEELSAAHAGERHARRPCEGAAGFVTESVRRVDERLRIPELNAGFDVPYWYQGLELTRVLRDEYGCYVDSRESARRVDADLKRLIPLCFKADVEEPGNYEVRLTLRGQGEICVFAGPRRLVRRESLPGIRSVTWRFALNVCDIIPRGQERRHSRRSIDIAIVGRDVRLTGLSFRRTDCPTLYIAGDSTVTDQPAEYPYLPGASYAGWGQMIGCYLSPRIAVSNHAHSGLTVESFRTEGHYAILRESVRAGDYVMFQFGHNDQKLAELQARGGYWDGLAAYVEETRQAGARPIIITPLARNSWKADDGSYNDLLEQYANACMELGRRYGVPVADLHGRSMSFVKERGLEGAKAFFFPRDFTHTNDYGAYRMAGFVVEECLEKARAEEYRSLTECMTERTYVWEGEDPEELPTVPERYRDVPKTDGEGILFEDLERPDEPLRRAEALDMVIRTARFFPTNVFNDLYEDVVGHEWYAGTVECAYQNGIIPPQMTAGNRLEPEKPVTVEEFLALAMGGYRSRMKMPEEKPCPADGSCTSYCVPYVRAAHSLGVIKEGEDVRAVITRGRAAEICRALDI